MLMNKNEAGSEAMAFANLVNSEHIRGYRLILGKRFLHARN